MEQEDGRSVFDGVRMLEVQASPTRSPTYITSGGRVLRGRYSCLSGIGHSLWVVFGAQGTCSCYHLSCHPVGLNIRW